MTIRIITDSASDIEQNTMTNVEVVPLKVTIGDVTYRDGVDMTKDEFYEMLESSEVLPQTSLATPFEFEEVYKKVTEGGDEAIVLPVSSKVSGTYQSAMVAAREYPNISVMDSLQGSAGQILLIRRAQQMIDQGMKREDIVRVLEEEKTKIRLYAAVDTLKYLEKGGRVTKGMAMIGSIIGIKPILTLENGELIAIGKARGSRKAFRFLNDKLEESGGIDFSKPFLTAYSGSSRAKLDQYIEDNKYLLNGQISEIESVQIGTAVGPHAGPGTVLVCYFGNK